MGFHLLLEIWTYKKFSVLFTAGWFTSVARWFEVLIFSVIAWNLTENASIAAFLVMLRLVAVAITGIFFSITGTFFPRKVVLVITTLLCAFTCLSIFLLSTFGIELNLISIGLISLVSGAMWSVDFSFRRPMLADTLPAHIISTGVSVDVLSTHATRILGPLLGGIFLAYLDESYITFFLFCLYFLSLLCVLTQRDTTTFKKQEGNFFNAFSRVLSQTRKNINLLTVILLTFIFNIFSLPFIALIGILLIEKFQKEALEIGLLTSLEGVGALLGGSLIAAFPPKNKRIMFTIFLAIILGSMISSAVTNNLIVYLVCIIAFGFSAACYSALQSTIIYLNSLPDLRSPTFSLLTIAIGCGSLGSLNIYIMSKKITTELITIIIGCEGILMLIFTLFFINFISTSTKEN